METVVKRVRYFYLSPIQTEILNILNDGGRFTSWEDGDMALDDAEFNTLTFRNIHTTFKILIREGIIEVKARPRIGCGVYGLSEKGVLFVTHPPTFQPRKQPPAKATRPITFYKDDNGCHICTSHSLSTKGYYCIMFNRTPTLIHRHLFESKHGKLAPGIIVRHKCDNRECINIDHLESGTKKDNAMDCLQRGRKPIGENTVMAKLKEKDVIEILAYGRTVSYAFLSRKYGVAKAAIRNIVLRDTWKHISV